MKTEIRKKYLKRRNSLDPGKLIAKSRAISERFFSLLEYLDAETVMFYVSFQNEVSTREAIRKALEDKQVVIPAVDGEELVVYSIEDYDNSLKKGSFGILEPVERQGTKVELEAIDLVVVPGVVFDRNGGRIGFGKGYYDRFLGSLKKVNAGVLTAGFSFERQLVDKLELEEADIRMDLVVTEKTVYRKE